MSQVDLKARPIEWACRTVLTVHFLLVLAGYANYIQAKYALTTPVIPRSTIDLISYPFLKLSLSEGIVFIISLWFYFIRFRIVVLSISSISVVLYWVITRYFFYLL